MAEVLKNYPNLLKSKLDEIESITQSFTEDQIIQTNLTAIENLCRDKIYGLWNLQRRKKQYSQRVNA